MSWQRIDEYTYIDDSLVTCAEYQLFIDEMREQGKYYQPDHWTSYQFPKGQAQAPILGVRYSDAVAFCDWLTQREGQELNYRLPISIEAKKTKLVLDRHPGSICYWIINQENKDRFIWSHQHSADSRAAVPNLHDKLSRDFLAKGQHWDNQDFDTLARTIDVVRDQAVALAKAINMKSELEDVVKRRNPGYHYSFTTAKDRLNKLYDRDRVISALISLAGNLHYDLFCKPHEIFFGSQKYQKIRSLIKQIDDKLDLSDALLDDDDDPWGYPVDYWKWRASEFDAADVPVIIDTIISNLALAYRQCRSAKRKLTKSTLNNLRIDIERICEKALPFDPELKFGFEQDPKRHFDVDFSLGLILNRMYAAKSNRGRMLALYDILVLNLVDNLNLALELHLDLFTLQERVIGRAPAFEGIRLVREDRVHSPLNLDLDLAEGRKQDQSPWRRLLRKIRGNTLSREESK